MDRGVLLALVSLALLGAVRGEKFMVPNATYFLEVFKNYCYLNNELYIENDLDFSGVTEDSINTITSCGFQGVLNGQGHAIRNFNLTSTSINVGLIGSTWNNITIKNIKHYMAVFCISYNL